MILTRAVATFTASSFGRLFAAGDALEMGIAEERLPQVGVARFARIAPEKSFTKTTRPEHNTFTPLLCGRPLFGVVKNSPTNCKKRVKVPGSRRGPLEAQSAFLFAGLG
jgi:hypothetical protein